MSDHTWMLLQMFFKLQCDFLPHFWRDFHANLDAYLKKLLKQKESQILDCQFHQYFFKPKINIDDAPAAGKQSTMDYDLAKKILIQNAWKYSHKRKQKWKIK